MLSASPAEAAVVRSFVRRLIRRRSLELAAELAGRDPDEPWTPYPHQVPPSGDWDLWLLLAGRGAGKTDAVAAYMDQHVAGPKCHPKIPGGHRMAIVAPTLGDAAEACVNGPSGIKAHNPDVRMVTRQGGTFVIWPSGAEARIFGAYTPDDVERLRAGGNRCLAWLEEFAAWRFMEACYDHLSFGLRIGPHPRAVASTTPKPKKLLKLLLEQATTATTRATTDDNPSLPAPYKRRLERYRGTRLGRQEIGGELLDDVPGALWTYDMIVHAPAPADLVRVVVAVDPSGGSDPENDEQGIGVVGLGPDGRGCVLADRSCRLSPDGWGRRAVQAYVDFAADAIVGEANFGGDMVEAVVRTAARAMGVTGVTYKPVHASRGKAVRAQPIAQLYAEKRVDHAEVYPELEEELTSWTPESGRSPNRLDALVWAVTELMVKAERQTYVY